MNKTYQDLNSRCKKNWDKMYANPADCRYSETRTLLLALGFLESNGSGSRVRFYHQETKKIVLLHRPHPGDVMEVASVKDVRNALREFYDKGKETQA